MRNFEIDFIVGPVQLEAGSSEMWLTFQCRDLSGTVRDAAISPYALQQLNAALHEGMLCLLNPVIRAPKSSYVEMSSPDLAREGV